MGTAHVFEVDLEGGVVLDAPEVRHDVGVLQPGQQVYFVRVHDVRLLEDLHRDELPLHQQSAVHSRIGTYTTRF